VSDEPESAETEDESDEEPDAEPEAQVIQISGSVTLESTPGT